MSDRPIRFEEIHGQPAAATLLRRTLAADRLPQALLFHGPDGVGKTTTARALSAALLCARPLPQGEGACGECEECARVRAGSHPDLLFVRRLSRKVDKGAPLHDPLLDAKEPKDLSSLIRVFQIRELTAHAGHAPKAGRRRIFIVDPADRMNHAAQNALLKTLEEPPATTLVMLVSSRPHLLLPTVRSRVFAVTFGPLPLEEVVRVLQSGGVDPAEARERALLARGRPGWALRMDPQAVRERRDGLVALLDRLGGDPRRLDRMMADSPLIAGENPDDCLQGLELLEALLRDAGRAAVGAPPDEAADPALAPRAQALAERLGERRLAALVEQVEALRGDLRFNVNRTLLAETLLTRLAAPAP